MFAHLGGYYYGDNHYDTPEYTQKVLKFLQDYVVTPPGWLFDSKIMSHLHVDRKKEIKHFKSEQQQHFDYAMERIEKAKAKEKDEILVKTLETLLTEVKTMKEKMETAYKNW